MKLIQNVVIVLAIGLLGGDLRAQTSAPTTAVVAKLAEDQTGRLTFFGSKTADLFSKEINESFKGVLTHNYVSHQDGKFPPGFLQASPLPQPWSGTMWTRDAGTFMRELVFWGYYEHACQVAQRVMDFAAKNKDGFIAFPRFFRPGDVGNTGTEIDGQAAIIIGMVSLWERLPAEHPFRSQLYSFLHQDSSPVRELDNLIEHHSLIPGSGEFGNGFSRAFCYNVVQNNLSALALLSAANLEDEAGDPATAKLWRTDADIIRRHMEKYFVGKDGTWIWCIDLKTLKPDPAILSKPVNVGFGGINGVACMDSDVLGFDPLASSWNGIVHSEKTFDKLYAVPKRNEQFKKYGIWSQFDLIHNGLLTSPSYGQGYAIQTMLLFDKLAMADHGLDFLAKATFDAPGITFSSGRLSPYYFYERLYSPDALGKEELAVGCGPLNLVCVSEPLKAARLILGVDDTSLKEVRIIPRLPPTWSGYEAKNWPIRTSRGVVRVDLTFERKDGLATFRLQIINGQAIPRLAVRLSGKNETVWNHRDNVEEVKFDLAAAP